MVPDTRGTFVAARSRTAIRRNSCSKPIATAISDGLITRSTTVFDYGCGHGGDVHYLRSQGIEARGWDPHYFPNNEIVSADVVNLGYVLNVIENRQEREQSLRRAFELARKVLIVAVRVENALYGGDEYADGVITRRGTFQKIYKQGEFLEYIEQTLQRRPHAAALGLAYVFRDQEIEAQYVASRVFTRRLECRPDLINEFSRDRLARQYVELANKLGRVPLPEEFPEYDKLLAAFGSYQRITRLALRSINPEAFEGSRAQRREDILAYLAMLRLQGIYAPPFHKLPAPIRADIKSIWRKYTSALVEGDQFLFKMGQPEQVRMACEAAQIGKRLPNHLYVHRSAEDELPVLLRLVILAAKQVVGELPYDLVKISHDGRAVSFLMYLNFDSDPHPVLLQSVRVYLPKAEHVIRDYQGSANPPILHRKDAFVSRTYPYFEKFRRLTEQEEAAGLLSAPGIGFRLAWEQLLDSRGLRVIDHQVVFRGDIR